MSERRAKYGNRRVKLDGFVFDSVKEANRYQELKVLEAAGEIADIEVHPRFALMVSGQKICDYEADFCYLTSNKMIVEDVKSEATRKLPVYRLKKKLLKACLAIEIREV